MDTPSAPSLYKSGVFPVGREDLLERDCLVTV